VNGRWQWGLKSQVIAPVLRRGTEGVVQLNGGEGKGWRGGSSPYGEGGLRPTRRRWRQNERQRLLFLLHEEDRGSGFRLSMLSLFRNDFSGSASCSQAS
jgi:hypothetical protein